MEKFKLFPNLKKVYIYPPYPTDSTTSSDNGFMKIYVDSMDGSPLRCFFMKDNKSFFFDILGGAPDNILLQQLPKPLICHNHKIQDLNIRLC